MPPSTSRKNLLKQLSITGGCKTWNISFFCKKTTVLQMLIFRGKIYRKTAGDNLLNYSNTHRYVLRGG